ncbi:glycosyltransferase family 4 protein [Chloroflexota bacterium]
MARQAKNKSSSLKVLYFGPYGRSGGIGGSARLRNMLAVLKKLGAQTRLITYLPEDHFRISRQKTDESLETTVISVNATAPKFLKLPALKLVFYYGLRYAGKSDLIFAHSPGIVYGFPALVMAKLFRKPLFIDLTDTRDPDTPGFLYRFILRHASIVFAVSHYLVDLAARAGSRRVVHAPGFINTDMFRFDAATRKKIRDELKLKDSNTVIGYAGAFSPDEGLTYLLQAVKKLSARFPQLKIVFLGGRNTPGADDIPQMVKELELEERVTFIPPQPYEAVPGYLSAFDIGVSPKVDKELNRAADPIRVYEYMAVGLPVVASAVGETAHAIEDGKDGFLFKPGDAEDLARVLEGIIQRPGSLQSLKPKAREKVIQGYSQEATLAKLKMHLKDLTAANR